MPAQRAWLVPEVVQTSNMDCGPAALKALLAGFGIDVSYGGLRELCRTDVDGTSITALEELAVSLGLEAEQVMLPAENVLLGETDALPAIAVVTLANGLTHFVVVWRIHGPLVQVMDPGRGRVWIHRNRLLADLYRHRLAIAADEWRSWAETDSYCDPLRTRLRLLGVRAGLADSLLARARSSGGWQGLASLEAAVRFAARLIEGAGCRRGREASALVERLFEHDSRKEPAAARMIPDAFWSVRPDPSAGEERLLFDAALIVSIHGASGAVEEAGAAAPGVSALGAELRDTRRQAPEKELWRQLLEDRAVVGLLLTALGFTALGAILEVFLVGSVFSKRAAIAVVDWPFVAFVLTIALMLGLEVAVESCGRYLGRRLELRITRRLYEKIPRLPDRYFRSRLVSDIAHRAFGLQTLRLLPEVLGDGFRAIVALLFTLVAIVALYPAGFPLALTALAATAALAGACKLLLEPHEARHATFEGALSRFYYDALMGQTPLRSHQAEAAFQSEQEALIVDWANSKMRTIPVASGITATFYAMAMLIAILLVRGFVADGARSFEVLTLLYFALLLPERSSTLVSTIRQYPYFLQIVLRVMEPLEAPVEDADEAQAGPAQTSPDLAATPSPGVHIRMEAVDVVAAGRTILKSITLDLAAGSHVAVVGASGAGKSTLAGLLLGWNKPDKGTIRVDGHDLVRGDILRDMRRATAWIDPQVYLWNDSLVRNIAYGSGRDPQQAVAAVREPARIEALLERLGGDDVRLGEAGRLVSGGEGQRVRFARALARQGVRLAILDEPFRGLDRGQRHELLGEARRRWRDATLIFISHDVRESLEFERVIVIDQARIVEDAAPADLLLRDSQFRRLLEAEENNLVERWSGEVWRRWTLSEGCLREEPRVG